MSYQLRYDIYGFLNRGATCDAYEKPDMNNPTTDWLVLIRPVTPRGLSVNSAFAESNRAFLAPQKANRATVNFQISAVFPQFLPLFLMCAHDPSAQGDSLRTSAGFPTRRLRIDFALVTKAQVTVAERVKPGYDAVSTDNHGHTGICVRPELKECCRETSLKSSGK
jgi:hypothetical protein